MAMNRKGLTMETSMIAKAKTATQIGLIVFILTIIGFKGLPIDWLLPMIKLILQMNLIYYLTGLTAIFTVVTGISYVYHNRRVIRQFFA